MITKPQLILLLQNFKELNEILKVHRNTSLYNTWWVNTKLLYFQYNIFNKCPDKSLRLHHLFISHKYEILALAL